MQLMDELEILRAPSRTVSGDKLHAEENLLGGNPDITAVGVTPRVPCPEKCNDILAKFGIPWAVAE